ncbi:MAG: hypothetical protein HZC46_03550 [Ignavibacterium album]|uniref:hypothetical protein n=1 Tax=Ignavibacterium album TaxID=591197 RepID=UPI0026EB2312|nr:hypothetical protein [Ignavibacterium album]MBI5661203.1 hypothetical protein [Ignavibacterium album]
MKKLILVLTLITSVSFAQFKESGFQTEAPRDGIYNKSSNFLFDFLNSENFSMKHSFSMSYSAFAGQGIALGVYTNSMMYKFSDNLNVQLDASIVNSPYSTFGKDFQNSLNGLYISRAAVNYKPWNDVYITLQYRSVPYLFNNPYNGYRNYYYSPFYNDYFTGF